MSEDRTDGRTDFTGWHTRQEMADLIGCSYRDVGRRVEAGEVEKDDTDPRRPRFRYRGKVSIPKPKKTGRTDIRPEAVLELARALEKAQGDILDLQEQVAFLAGTQRRLEASLPSDADGQETTVRPSRPLLARLLSKLSGM